MMKAVELRLAKDYDKSFAVFRETGKFFPVPWHYHPEYELVLVTKSTGRRMVGDHIGYFDEGDLVFMGPLLPHVWINDTIYLTGQADHVADAVVIHFSKNFLGNDILTIPEMERLKDILNLANQGLVIKGQTRKKINAVMSRMLEMNGIQRLSALFTILDLISSTSEYEVLASPAFCQNIELKASNRFNKITEYIMQNFDRDITLPEVASVANMGVTTFCNFFKEFHRKTFIDYLNTLRIGHACKLLAEKNETIVQVAYECGFNNLANFNRQFRKLKNMTPTEFRKTVNV